MSHFEQSCEDVSISYCKDKIDVRYKNMVKRIISMLLWHREAVTHGKEGC